MTNPSYEMYYPHSQRVGRTRETESSSGRCMHKAFSSLALLRHIPTLSSTICDPVHKQCKFVPARIWELQGCAVNNRDTSPNPDFAPRENSPHAKKPCEIGVGLSAVLFGSGSTRGSTVGCKSEGNKTTDVKSSVVTCL